ncbi:MAG TPA: hypothetical protein VNT30_09300 [Stellaceae bacterium]|nr:hypothetical protein [Stellaceae bacterium]
MNEHRDIVEEALASAAGGLSGRAATWSDPGPQVDRDIAAMRNQVRRLVRELPDDMTIYELREALG